MKEPPSRPVVTLAAVCVGATATLTQVVLLREFLAVFYGNELVIGIVLAIWMVFTGLGSYLSRWYRRGVRSLSTLFMLTGALPLVTILLLHLLRKALFLPGEMAGLPQFIALTSGLLLPFCLLSGSLFPLLAHAIADAGGAGGVSRVYAAEAFGSMAGGIAYSLLLANALTSYQTLILAGEIALAASLVGAWRHAGRRFRAAIVGEAVMLVALPLSLNLEWRVRAAGFPGQDLLAFSGTPYGDIAVTATGEQRNFFENNVLLHSTGDVALREEQVHYAMLQRTTEDEVLIISGGISGTLQEALKYPVRSVDYVENNPAVIRTAGRFGMLPADPRVHVIAGDARRFVRETGARYAVVLVNVPDPSTAQINRFYSSEFFASVKRVLEKDGVMSVSLASSADYLSPQSRSVRSVLLSTLKKHFGGVVLVPGSRDFFLASDGPLRLDFARLAAERKTGNTYVNEYYLDDRVLRERSASIMGELDSTASINTDLSPISYHLQQGYWLSQFEVGYWAVIALCVGALAVFVSRLDGVSAGIFSGGCTAASVEVLLLTAFQAAYGYVYEAAGLLIGLFMAGLAAGALLAARVFGHPSMRIYGALQGGLAVCVVLLPGLLVAAAGMAFPDVIGEGVFSAAMFVLATLVGAEFSLAASLRSGDAGKTASSLYGIDLAGSSIGALAVSALLIPVLGMVAVCLVLAAVNALTAGWAFLSSGAPKGDLALG